MAKNKLKQLSSTVLILLAVCVISIFSACNSVKSIYFVPGEWSAENVQVGEIEIGKITLTITETYEEGEGYIVSGGNTYGCYVNISGEDMEVNDGADAISKYERSIRFIWKEKIFHFLIETKQGSDNIYINAVLDIFENHAVTDSTTFTMY